MTESDRSKALAELLATPLDEYAPPDERQDRRERRPAPWGVLLAMLLGAVVVFAGYRLADGDTDDTTTVTTTIPTTTSPPAASSEIFPPGFTPIDESVAVKIVRTGRSGDDFAVTMTSAVARGLDAASTTAFTGGRWAALLDDGTTVNARGQAVEGGAPGVVTALFDPDEVTADNLVALRLSERWYHRTTDATQDLEIADLPWTMPEPALLDLGDGMQLIVQSMELSETGGVVEWSLAGGPELGIVTLEIALEEGSFDGQPRMMIPISRIDRFFFDPATAAPEGRIELSGPTAADGEGIARGFAYWAARLTVPAPADVEIPVPDLGS